MLGLSDHRVRRGASILAGGRLCAGIAGVWTDSWLLIILALTLGAPVFLWFIADALPHNHWRHYRRRRWEDP